MPPCSGHAVGAPQLQAHAQVRAAGSPRPQPACSGRPRPVGCHADEHWPPAGLGGHCRAAGGRRCGRGAAQSPAPSSAPLTRRRPHPQSLEKYVLSFRSRSMNRCSSPRRQTWPSAEPPAAHCPARPAEPLVSAAGRWAPPAGSAARADCTPRRPRKPRGAPVPRPPLQPAPLARRRDEPSGSRRRRVGPVTAARRTPPAARGEGEGRGASSGTTCSVSRGFCGHKFPSPAGKDGAVTPEKGGNLQPPSRLGPEPRGLAGPGRSAGGAGQGWRPASAGRAGLWARGAAPTTCRSSLSPGASSRDTGQGRPLPSSPSGPPDPTLGVHGAGRDRAARPRAGGGRGRRTGIEVLHAGGPPGTGKNARVQAADGIPPSKEPALGL